MKNYFFLLVVAFILNSLQAQVLDNLGRPTDLHIQGVIWFPEKTHATSANIGLRLKYNFDTQNFDYTGGGWRSFNNLLFHGSNLHFVAAETWMNSPSFPNTMSTQDLINNYAKMTLIT